MEDQSEKSITDICKISTCNELRKSVIYENRFLILILSTLIRTLSPVPSVWILIDVQRSALGPELF